MKQFIVGHIDWYDHNLTLERVEAKDWREAFTKHSKAQELFSSDPVPEDLKAAKQFCFDCDCMMDAIEVEP